MFENRKMDSYIEKIPENYTKYRKDLLLNDLVKLDRSDCQQMALTQNFLWIVDKKGSLHSLQLRPLENQTKSQNWRKINTI